MAVTMPRPSALLDLPDRTHHTEPFHIGGDGEMVAHWTQRLLEQVRHTNGMENRENSKGYSLVYSQRAQQWASNSYTSRNGSNASREGG